MRRLGGEAGHSNGPDGRMGKSVSGFAAPISIRHFFASREAKLRLSGWLVKLYFQVSSRWRTAVRNKKAWFSVRSCPPGLKPISERAIYVTGEPVTLSKTGKDLFHRSKTGKDLFHRSGSKTGKICSTEARRGKICSTEARRGKICSTEARRGKICSNEARRGKSCSVKARRGSWVLRLSGKSKLARYFSKLAHYFQVAKIGSSASSTWSRPCCLAR